jgi:hypothetical protein
MVSKAILTLALLAAATALTGCGTSSTGMSGSKHQTATGVTESGYPGGQPADSSSPALGSSSEQHHSDAGKPKVPKAD